MDVIRNIEMKKRNMIAFFIAIVTISIIANSAMMPSLLAAPIVGTNINITSEPHGQNEPNIAINPLHNTLQPMDIHIAVGANDYRGGRSVPGLYTSTDLTTWTFHSVLKPTYEAYGNPVLAYDSAGNLYYAYMAFEVDVSGDAYNAAIYVSKSADEGVSWAFYRQVSGLGSGTDPYNDRPWLAIDRSNNYIYVTWTLWHGKGASCLGSDIMFSRSIDNGLSFSAPMRISSSYLPVGQQRQWSQIAIGPSGEVYVTWRRLGAGSPAPTRAILMAKSTDHGASFGSEAIVIQAPDFSSGDYLYDWADPPTCTWPQIAVGPEGNVYIAWHAWIAEYDRDFTFLRSTTGGTSWSSKIAVASTTRDQFWPVLAVAPSGRVDAVWYDRRDDSNNRLVNLYYTTSLDQGVTFDPAITKVTTATSNTLVPCTGSVIYFGDYIDLEETSDGAALAVWTDTRAGNQEIFIASISQVTAPTYDVTIDAYCNTEAASVSVAITMDGNPTGFNTPHTFTGLSGSHTFTVPSADANTHLFKQWSTGSTSLTITVSTGGTYTAYYEAPPPVAPVIESSDSTGTKKDSFMPGEAVYAYGSGYSPSTNYNIYVVNDVVTWSDGTPIPAQVSGITVTSDSFGNIHPSAVWGPPLTLGKYDIVVDVNGNGVYNAGVDALDDSDIEVTAGFNVIPEVPLGTAMTFLSMIIALVGFIGFKRYRARFQPQ